MKLTISIILIVFFLRNTIAIAQEGNANLPPYSKKISAQLWKKIDQRMIPSWYQDAKFGIFIHWGPYSVPSWSPVGTYTEWYQKWLVSRNIFGNNNPDPKAIPNFQDRVYGESSSYYDFGKMFKAELYNPNLWAKLFRRSGAKYVVLTSKHHDGFTLWPNREAQDMRQFKWNSGEVGAKKDLIAPYMSAMREEGLKAGLYYSLYEWYHPWYVDSDPRFVTKHYHPQFKDLVNRYVPDLIFADGAWDHDDRYWRSGELLTWLYEESPCKEYVVINDRWFKGCRHKHGGYRTTEYEVKGMEGDKPWEENRGMGFSFGYNRAENIENYTSAKALVLMLCDLVSMGGNLLLNVGPRADGTIPVIMQERLLQIGKWLDVNGEAIYGTRKWHRSFQWSEGDRDYTSKKKVSYVGGDYILKQTVRSSKGKAVKELFFTKKGDDLYAISPIWPGDKLIVRNVKVSNNSIITLLGHEGPLAFKESNGGVIVSLPPYNPNGNLVEYAYVIKIENIQE
ncbi:alpha-L-fucosidase [Halosquirtibacter xylanolyticus]|uniref:alpha-L-fucosidase n=1 Tax=Halosquirtibacter xylanolyticus TaxID=3374599 RepID=UPI0037499FAF|nr:alpha-L-fucosidase [Prolixibacteraceae bacterium]